MLKTIKYGFYVEDEAQAIFLENILPQIINHLKLEDSYSFEKDNLYTSVVNLFPLNHGGKTKFDKTFKRFCEIGIINYEQDVFFLGRDLDKATIYDLEKKISEMQESLGEFLKSKVIIFLPTRCTEHWLRYIKELKKTKNQDLSQKFEEQRNDTVKKNVYGRKKRVEQAQYIHNLCQDINIAKLSQHAESFKHFVESIQIFLNRLN